MEIVAITNEFVFVSRVLNLAMRQVSQRMSRLVVYVNLNLASNSHLFFRRFRVLDELFRHSTLTFELRILVQVGANPHKQEETNKNHHDPLLAKTDAMIRHEGHGWWSF